jgi:pullulanase/glycogen debranching enzyme
VEILRSKSGDENSYDSGDWFNRLSFTKVNNNWNKGLPPGWQSENLDAWDDWETRLDTIPQAGSTQLNAALAHFKEMLTIRKSSPLFRLRSMSEIQNRVSFPANIWNPATSAFDGRLAVMKITDFSGTDLDSSREVIWVLVNTAWSTWLNFYDDDVKRSGFQLHPVLQSTDYPYLDGLLDACCTGSARVTAFTDHSTGGGTISVPPQSILIYTAP